MPNFQVSPHRFTATMPWPSCSPSCPTERRHANSSILWQNLAKRPIPINDIRSSCLPLLTKHSTQTWWNNLSGWSQAKRQQLLAKNTIKQFKQVHIFVFLNLDIIKKIFNNTKLIGLEFFSVPTLTVCIGYCFLQETTQSVYIISLHVCIHIYIYIAFWKRNKLMNIHNFVHYKFQDADSS